MDIATMRIETCWPAAKLEKNLGYSVTQLKTDGGRAYIERSSDDAL